MSAIYDNWERLVAAVVKKQQLWELFHEQSRSPSILSDDASDFSSSDHDLDFDYPSPGSSSRSQKPPPKLVLISDFSPAFDIKDVTQAHPEWLGQGTLGSAYLVRFDGGQKFVLKRLNSVAISEVDFGWNMKIVGDVRHDNVVALRAYYSSTKEKLLLYDYYSNGTMHSLLFGERGENRGDVNWETRLNIAIGAARGIAEIHKQLGGKFVHGNIKASNIFLNQQLYGCVSDFGLTNMKKPAFMPSAMYYAPEVKIAENVSQASDVYSFGILLLELLTRKSTAHVPGGPAAVDVVKIVNSVRTKERAAKVFDPDLLKNPSISKQMINMLEIGMRCVAESPKKRPNIFEVVKMLEDIAILNSRSQEEGKLVFLQDGNPIFELEPLFRADAEVLGKGTFGTSYKATLDNGHIVVVKRLRYLTATFKDFQQHMDVFRRINHIHVGIIKGYYFNGYEKLLLFEYYNQGSLSALLKAKRGVLGISMDWGSRVKIALGAARGIAHVHGLGRKHVFGNIKSTNIFLSGQNHSIIALDDAGLTKLMDPVRLSPDYCAPEVANSRKVSQASDVYSFGVVLLELVSGKLAQDLTKFGSAASLAERIRSVDRRDWNSQVLDMECLKHGNEKEMMQLLDIAMSCVSIVPKQRPRIFDVVKVLEEISGLESETILEEPSIQSGLEYLLEDLLPLLLS